MPSLRRLALVIAAALGCGPRCACGDAAVRPVDPRDFGDAVIADAAWRFAQDDGGVLRVGFNHADVVVGRLVFGGTGEGAIDATIGATTTGGDTIGFLAEVLPLRLRVAGSARPDGEALVVEYRIEADADLHDLRGGGLEFAFRSDARIFGTQAPPPTALDGDRGFEWHTSRGALRFEFDPPLAGVEIDPVTDAVRCSFYRDEIVAGTRTITLRIVGPEGSRVRPPTSADYAAQGAGWHADTLRWDEVPVDLSFLNADDRPAGIHGPARIEGDRLVRGDGAPLRLWGTNVAAYALFSQDDAAIAAQAHRLAAFGFNLVRIHHHDSAWVEPNVFGRHPANTRTLDEAALERIDRWVAALEAEGIYVWLDLEDGRTFTAQDEIDAFDELMDRRTQGAAFVNPSVAGAMKGFARSYLDRVNPHTHRRILDDPALAFVMVTNENDITHHFGNPMTAGTRPRHRAWLEARVRSFAARTGLDIPSPVEPWRTGATKLALADVEAEFFLDAIADLRDVGYRGAIASAQIWGDQGLHGLPSLTTGDVIDVHSYGDAQTLRRNPHVDANLLHPIGASAIAGLPTTVTEWNIPAPARDRFVGPTLVAATAALQGWDAMMLFTYASMPLEEPTRFEIWSALDDPAIMAMMPAAALMFRRGDVAPARERYAIAIDPGTLFERSSHAQNLATIRSLVERSQVRLVLPSVPELPWLRGTEPPRDAILLDDADHDHLEGTAHAIESDTGELRRDWALGIHTVATAHTVSATGAIGGRSISLDGVKFSITTAHAAVAISSLDGRAITDSADLLLATVAQVAPSPSSGRPLRSEPVTGVVTLRSAHARLRWRALGGQASAIVHDSIAVDGIHRLDLGGAPVHFWRVNPLP